MAGISRKAREEKQARQQERIRALLADIEEEARRRDRSLRVRKPRVRVACASVPQDVYDRIGAVAAQKGLTRSLVVRAALERFLEATNDVEDRA